MTRIFALAAARFGLTLCWINTRAFVATDVPLPAPASNLRFGQASLAQCLAAAENDQLGMSVEFVRSAFARRDMCHAVWATGQMVCYAWRSQDQAPHNGALNVRVPVGCSYGYKAFTLPAYRGRGFYPRIAELEAHSALAEGLSTGVSFTEFSNLSSIKADRKFGNRILGIAGYWKIGSRFYPFASAKVKALGFAFVPSSD